MEASEINQKLGISQKQNWLADSDHEVDGDGKMIGDIEQVQVIIFWNLNWQPNLFQVASKLRLVKRKIECVKFFSLTIVPIVAILFAFTFWIVGLAQFNDII